MRGRSATRSASRDQQPRRTIPGMESAAAENREATEAWSGPLFELFMKYRDLTSQALGAHGDVAVEAHPPHEGDRVLDVGCGFGETTLRLAELVGPEGSAVGVDVSEPFIAAAKADAANGPANVEFMVGDVQVAELDGEFDYVFSRMGLMFAANPVALLRNIRESMSPGGRLCGVVWRRKLDNEWVRRAELVVEEYVEHPEETDEPTCGPGPFSMANADTVSEQLTIAGYEQISFRRCDLPLKIGDDLDSAVEFNMSLGPAGEVLRLWEDRIDDIRPKIAADLRKELADFEGPDGVIAPASTWIIGATAPAQRG
jgi:SAM-dependent methyltransferase